MSASAFYIASCEHCHQHIEFPAEGLGLRVTCPHCALETVLLEDLPLAPEKTDQITAAELKAAFNGVVQRRRVSVLYQAGLLLVVFFMVLLPIAYLAFASFVGYCVYWYATHAWVLFASLRGGIYVLILKVIVYVGPLVGGVVAVFFMFKPILARSRNRGKPIELNPARHGRLYQFIAELSDLLRVPMPRQIYLDCELNASVAFRRGALSLLGNDLVLNLGLPLVAGLNTRQFAATVAHELGHCTQGFAMRLGYVINRIDGWFVRVVYERDTWDDALEEWSDSTDDWRFSLIMACVRFAVWLSRKVLLLLMMTGHAASCFLSRQMEFHADACATAVAGSDGLESLLIRLRELSVLEGLGYQGLSQIWSRQHRLPNSVADYLDELEKRLPPHFHENARLTLLNESAGLFATHPTDAQRIQKARRHAIAGVFSMEKPARALFSDFPAASQAVTSRYYRQELRLAVTDPMLRPVNEFFSELAPLNPSAAMPRQD